MASEKIEHPTVAERTSMGEEARSAVPLAEHANWEAPSDRPDPVTLLAEQNRTRDEDLVPVRHGRMMVSPFTFYRGAARVMASDLSHTPNANLIAQLCGDAHLSNFGVFASPERRLLFDVNDFDETLPGPFEYDVKRLAASLTIAARHNAFSPADARQVTVVAGRSYREAMAEFAEMRTMELWYAHLDEDELRAGIAAATTATSKAEKGSKGKKKKKKEGSKDEPTPEKVGKRADKILQKAHTRDSLQALSKLGELVDGQYRIVSQPPIVVPLRELSDTYGIGPEAFEDIIVDQFRRYRGTLQDDRRHLLERFQIIDMARKVVGVGSVGTRAFIVLLQGRDQQDPLFLQVKEATRSVLEDHLPESRYRQPGERVVQGQRLMQAASDIYLGWTRGEEADRYYYWRQLRDMKGSADVESMWPEAMSFYARICGWTLARAHARSGDPVAISAYLGNEDTFDEAIADFSEGYADQNARDYEAFTKAIASGRLKAKEGL